MDLVTDEIQSVVIEWDELKSMQEGFIAQHTLVVLWLVIEDEEYSKCTKR